MFIIDFDDTLFDTHGFKHARLRKLQACGVPETLYWETYQDARVKRYGVITYTNERHAYLLSLHGFSYADMLCAFNEISGEAVKSFLFSDALSFIASLKTYNHSVILLSLGDPAFQEMKVKYSGIRSLFDRVFIVQDTKIAVLDALVENAGHETVWLVNDQVKETRQLIARFPFIHAVLKRSPSFPSEVYDGCGLPCFGTLTEIQHYVKGQLG